MPGPDYYRRQADICLGMSVLGEDPAIAAALIALAKEFLAKAEAAERADSAPLPHVIDREESEGDHI